LSALAGAQGGTDGGTSVDGPWCCGIRRVVSDAWIVATNAGGRH
jgi:hypothetical protein